MVRSYANDALEELYSCEGFLEVDHPRGRVTFMVDDDQRWSVYWRLDNHEAVFHNQVIHGAARHLSLARMGRSPQDQSY